MIRNTAALAVAANLTALLLAAAPARAEDVYQEDGGLVVMEMENTSSSLGEWVRINQGETNYVDGATNNAHLEFTGNSPTNGSPNSPLAYTFKIYLAGDYHLNLRARKRLDGAASDLCNDCYVRMEGNFTSGSTHYDTSTLTQDTKLYGGSATGWGWAKDLDGNGADHKPAIYTFVADETYTLTISGRSQRFNIDRIVLRHSSVSESSARSTSNPESSTTPIVNAPPTVSASVDQASKEDTDGNGTESFSLTGTASDSDGTVESYVWSDGTNTWNGANQNVTLGIGAHVLTLTVTDNRGATATASVTCTVLDNLPPIADAGPDMTAQDDNMDDAASVTLDGSGSSDPSAGGSISSYAWSVAGTQIATGATPTVTLDVGIHTVTLTVTDDKGATATDTVQVVIAFQDDDGDGMADTWEVDWFGSTSAADGTTDADEDTYTDLSEFLGGSDPLDPTSHPALSGGGGGVSCSARDAAPDACAAAAVLGLALCATLVRRRRAVAPARR